MKARRRREKFCGRVGCTLVFCGVLEDTFGAYDAAGVRAVLVDRREEVDRKLAEVGAAPPSFLSLLAANVNDAGGVASPAGATAHSLILIPHKYVTKGNPSLRRRRNFADS